MKHQYSKKHHYWALSPEAYYAAEELMSQEEKDKMSAFVKEACNITKFSSYAERLLFEDGMKKGWLAATRLEQLL